MAKIVPRLSLLARSFSQLSMIMKAPAVKNPEPTRNRIQAIGTTKIPVQEDDDRGARGERGEGADMADAAHDDRGGQAAEDETRRPAAAEQAKLPVRKAFRRAAQRQEQAEHAVRREQESGRQKQREDGNDLAGQGVFRI